MNDVADPYAHSLTCMTDISNTEAAASAAKNADQVVLVLDNAKDGGGEGHDRYTIALSDDQIKLAKAVLDAAKTKTAVVLVNGGAISIDGIKEEANSIIEAFMPGVHGATAIAETLWGDNNPGGKLPVTIYPSSYINDVDMLSMDMTNRSYRYYTGTPLFPFGFGLSYTTFSLYWASATSSESRHVFSSTKDTITHSVKVTNTGKVPGDEVVQAFFRPKRESFLGTLPAGTPVPLKQLYGFERVHLKPGEHTILVFHLSAEVLALVDMDGHTSLHPGEFEIVFYRGHGEELVTPLQVDVPQPVRLKTFRKWW